MFFKKKCDGRRQNLEISNNLYECEWLLGFLGVQYNSDTMSWFICNVLTFNSIINVFVRRRNKLYSSIIASHREDVEVVFIVMDVFIQKNHVNGTLCCRCYGKYQKKNKKDVQMRKR